MRIGVNTIPLFPGQIGGMETYTLNLLSHLPELDRQHAYYLFVARYNRHLFDFRHPKLVEVDILSLRGFRYATTGLPGLLGSMARRFPRLARSVDHALANADMLRRIQNHGIDLWFCPLISLAPRRVTLPSVVSIPDLQPEFYPDFFTKDLLEWHRRRYPASCRDATRVITFSEFSRATIVDRYGITRDKIHVIPLAVGEEFLLPEDGATLRAVQVKYGLPSGYAFYPANTWHHKNHPALLKALHLLRTRHGKRLPCVLTGVQRGGHAALVKAIEQHGLTGQVRLLGYVDRADMPLLYRGARCLVFPSLFEGFGLPVLEAMASDCPVLCSKTTSLPEVAANAALLFDPNDPEEIADCMARLLEDHETARRLREAGRERYKQFSWERTSREVLKVLEEAASVRPRPAGNRS